MIDIKVTGLREVDEQLRKLGAKDGTRIVRRALMVAGEEFVRAARANLSNISNSGALRESIGKKFVIGRRVSQNDSAVEEPSLPPLGSRFAVLVAPLRRARTAVALYNLSYRRRRRDIYHGHYVEFGTRFLGARPFLQPALQSQTPSAVRQFAIAVERGVELQLRRNAKRAKPVT